MASNYASIEELLRSRQPQLPVYCVCPHVYCESTRRFLNEFQGRVLYAFKANNVPTVIRTLHTAGVQHFDCACLPEIEIVKSLFDDASCYLKNPVRVDGHAYQARRLYGVRHFVVDHLSGLAALLEEIDVRRSVIFARMAVSHSSAIDELSSKFGLMGAYNLSARTAFNGFFSKDVVTIESEDSLPPTG